MKLSKKTKPFSSGSRFIKLVRIMAKLRGKHGCPWDKHQSHKSLLKYLFSEAQELKLAVKKNDWDNIKEELGDILLQVVFHSRIAEENGYFNAADVIDGINEKLTRRHPHVFGGKKLHSPRQVYVQWNRIKRLEKKSTRARK